MKTLPFALAVSASAMVVSLGWFGWLSTHGTPPSSATAHGSSALAQASAGLSGVRPQASGAVYAREYPGVTTQPESARTERSSTALISVSSVSQRQAERAVSLQAMSAGTSPAVAPQYFSERRSFHPQAPPSEISDALNASPTVVFQGSSMIGYVDVELGSGARVPVALSENGEDSSPAMAEAKEQIAREFEDEILQIADSGSSRPEELDKAWTEAQQRADNRFRLFYGKDVFNRESLRSGQKDSPAGRVP